MAYSESVVWVTLSRRNLLTLLSKLDRRREGEHTHCTIEKPPEQKPGVLTTYRTVVRVVEDDVMYQDRKAGPVHHKDTP